MKIQRLSILLLLLLTTVAGFAQFEKRDKDEPKHSGPDLQTIDDGFFDPTSKPKRDRMAEYHFGVDYRIEAGYAQSDLRIPGDTLHYGYLHGIRLGATFGFRLPYDFQLRTGLLYQCSAGAYQQHLRSLVPVEIYPYAQSEVIYHNQVQHMLQIPIQVEYRVSLPKQFGLFFYTGPILEVGLAWHDRIEADLSNDTHGTGLGALQWAEQNGIHTSSYDRYAEGEMNRFLLQYSIGGGIEWSFIRLQAGYDFGLTNIQHQSVNDSRLWQWSWNIGLSFLLNPTEKPDINNLRIQRKKRK